MCLSNLSFNKMIHLTKNLHHSISTDIVLMLSNKLLFTNISLANMSYIYIYILAMPVLKHGGHKKNNNLGKEIEARSVHCPQHHCAKKASITTTREQSVIVMSQLLAAGRLLYRWRHNGSIFSIIQSRDGIKCGFTSVKSQEWHKWFVHRIHGVRNNG